MHLHILYVKIYQNSGKLCIERCGSISKYELEFKKMCEIRQINYLLTYQYLEVLPLQWGCQYEIA